MSSIIFTYEGIPLKILCLTDDKMRDICNKYSLKINMNINSLIFLYGGIKVDFELTFKEQAKKIDRERNEMSILVYLAKEEKGLKCPNCGEIINLDIFDKIIKNQNDLLNGLKIQIENILNLNDINLIKNQIKIIQIVINNIIVENENNKRTIQNSINNFIKGSKNKRIMEIDNNEDNSNDSNNLINNPLKKGGSIIKGKIGVDGGNKDVDNNLNNDDYKNIGCVIKGLIEVEEEDNNKDNNYHKDILLFKEYKEGIDVYLNDVKINTNIIKYNHITKNKKYEFKIIFNSNVTNLKCFFELCSNIIYLDFSNLDTSKVDDMSYMFNQCLKLKNIKGINNFNTSQVFDMSGMFQLCIELEYLDLSNFDTSKVTDMSFMFSRCLKLKDIKGINKFNTNRVTEMNSMFQECSELEYLDLSNFNTSKVIEMQYMFYRCSQLKEIKGINNFNINKVINSSKMFGRCKKLTNINLSIFNENY